MATKYIISVILLAATLAGCSINSREIGPTVIPTELSTLQFNQPTSLPTIPTTLHPTPSTVPPPSQTQSTQQIVLDRAFAVINALKNQDMSLLAQYVHPQMGLRFSPYATVKDADQGFTADQVAGLMADPTVYLWGNYDGSGEPINLAFADYYAKFVYDEDFANAPEMSLNHRLGTGNSLDNIFEYYPSSIYVEFYFPGFDPQYNGMDWKSLRLVFMQQDGTWYLVGIVHDQWTI